MWKTRYVGIFRYCLNNNVLLVTRPFHKCNNNINTNCAHKNTGVTTQRSPIYIKLMLLKKLQNIRTNFGIYNLLLSFQIFTRICQMNIKNILAFHIDCD